MKRLDDVESALGEPTFRRTLGGSAAGAVIARWRHGAALIPLDPDATGHVVLSLSGGEAAAYSTAGERKRHRTEIGRVSLMPRDEPVTAEIGPADAFHIFLPASIIEVFGRRTGRGARSAAGVGNRLRRHALEILVAAHRPDPDADLRVEIGVVDLASSIASADVQPSPAQSVGGLTPIVRRRIDELVSARIESDCARPPSLTEMAAAARLSIDHFVRMFRKDTGTTPYLYASRRRLEHSMALLLQPNISIGDAAYRSGFCSPSHFVAAFRRQMGVTPAAFRDSVRN